MSKDEIPYETFCNACCPKCRLRLEHLSQKSIELTGLPITSIRGGNRIHKKMKRGVCPNCDNRWSDPPKGSRR